jgi:hypothetical protein
MKYVLAMLAAVALFAGAALAQVVTVDYSGVAASTMTPVTSPVCPFQATLPQPCPILTMEDTAGRTRVLVLGTQERYALEQLDQRDVDWRDNSMNYNSLFEPGNPRTSHRPNAIVTRGGNPYYPYQQVTAPVRVPAMATRTVEVPATLSTTDRNVLTMVTNRYRGLTPTQAQALGYQASGSAIPGMGQMYVNQALIDNRFDAMMPEAFIFSPDGRLLAVQYMVRSATPVTLFGQPTRTSTTMNGVQYLTAWLYESNPNGFFMDINPNIQ